MDDSKVEPLSAFAFDSKSKSLSIIDQTLLPTKSIHVPVHDTNDGYRVIKHMLVRGAPCIAAVGCLSLVVEMNASATMNKFTNIEEFRDWLETKANYLIESRPTAINLKNALDKMVTYCKLMDKPIKVGQLIEKLTHFCESGLSNGLKMNMALGDYGADEFLRSASETTRLNILTHCNTGSLATVGYGTALGVVRSLHKRGKLNKVFFTETRPYNQGSRLTGHELITERIPATLIADNMVAYLMSNHRIDAVVVGADCVASNGDTANKIGTMQIAILAKEFKVPFYVACPAQSVDLNKKDSSCIKIELRAPDELRRVGDTVLAPEQVDVWNPCFDVTPASLITKFITEFGTCTPMELKDFVSNIRSNKQDSECLF